MLTHFRIVGFANGAQCRLFHLGGERYHLATQFFSVRVFLDCMTPSYESENPSGCL